MITTAALQKNDRVQLRNGWLATVKGKAKGIRILLEVEGYCTEMGDCYVWDIKHRLTPAATAGLPAGKEPLTLTPTQSKSFDRLQKAGFA